jgi:hypothetical protein
MYILTDVAVKMAYLLGYHTFISIRSLNIVCSLDTFSHQWNISVAVVLGVLWGFFCYVSYSTHSYLLQAGS